MKQITFKQYKAIDISILSVLLIVFEALAVRGSNDWFSHNDVALVPLISLTPLVMVITMLRWSEFAFVPAIIGGVAYCIGYGGNWKQYIIYSLGNLLGLISILIIKKIGKDAVRKKISNILIVSTATYLAMTVGRWLVSLVFDFTFDTFIAFITTDIISLVVMVVGLIALRTSDGMLEDQKSYLLRIERERQEEAERKATTPYQGIYGEEDDDEIDDDFDDDLDDDYLIDDLGGEDTPQPENENNEENISEDKI